MTLKSKAHQRLFAIVKAVRDGEISRSEVSKNILTIVDSGMSEEDINDFAHSKRKHLKNYVQDSLK